MFYESLIAAVLGLLLHFSMKWAEARVTTTPPPGLFSYVGTVPAKSLVAVLSAAAMFWVAHGMEWLNVGMGFTCGYMGNSLVDNVAKRFVPQQ